MSSQFEELLKRTAIGTRTIDSMRTQAGSEWNPPGDCHLRDFLAAVAGCLGPCAECGGKGWHIGDCHPRETCGACNGAGVKQLGVEDARALLAVVLDP